MSRVIVKNLPKNITESQLRSVFSENGIITDVQLKYTKEGVFRQFAFIGFQNDDQGQATVHHMNGSCIQTNRITVEPCEALGAATKPKSWSKYSADSSAYRKVNGIEGDDVKNEKIGKDAEPKKKRGERIEAILDEHKDDPKFIEFLNAHGKHKGIWDNDLGLNGVDEPGTTTTTKKVDESPEIVEEKSNEDEKEQIESETKLADKEISDADYMKSLQKKSTTIKGEIKAASNLKQIDLLTIKIRNIPYKAKRQDVINFFKPTKPHSVRLPTKVHGICYVGFKTEADFKKAMLRNRSFWKGKQLLFTDFTEKNKQSKEIAIDVQKKKNPKWAKQEEALKNEEDISESGRIFFRNLAYGVTDDSLRELFGKYGPVADISLPTDPTTRIIKGFGTVTFVMPEHALQAFNDLDGSIFNGRLLHLMPGKSKDHEELNEDGLTFKQKKALQQKKMAGSTHNWNTLFLGTNAVADLLAKHYNTTKEQIFDQETGGSGAAVRMALGETEIVLQMKKFLEQNDVCLDVFNEIPKKKSKTVIIAKNLPAATTVQDLQPLFAKYGLLGRFVLPPTGVTAIIEFLDPVEAKTAFKKLAYSKFKNLPLYLEWAPENTFRVSGAEREKIEPINSEIVKNPFNNSTPVPVDTKSDSKEINQSAGQNDNDDDENDDIPPEDGTTLFIRNLNFSTREPAVREHFKSFGPIHIIQVAMKKDPSNPSQKISLGYGFIQFKKRTSTEKVLSTMQFTIIEGNAVELKRSDRTLQSQVQTTKKSAKVMQQTGTKILVRNIPFQANQHEIRSLFQTFGELKTVRLPKKMSLGTESHRGFGFVDFVSKNDAKKAFESLCESTHLYGRRLVLEWAAADDGVEELRKRTAEHFHSATKTVKRNAIFDTSNIEDVADDDEDM